MTVRDWDKYPNFAKAEFDCKHTGRNEMQELFLDRLQALRTEYGKPITITSGYRYRTHPVESRKQSPGYHTQGIACDIGCGSDDAFTLIRLAMKHGFTGIGVSQKAGLARFIHLDMRSDVPRVYSY